MEIKKSDNGLKLFDNFGLLFSHPNLFFEKIKEEDGILNSLVAYLIVGTIMGGVYRFFVPFLFPYSYLIWIIGGYLIISVICLFVYSALIQGIVKIFGGVGSYANTFNVTAYSFIVALPLPVIPFIGMNDEIYSLVLGIIGGIYSLVLGIIGLSRVHETSKMKATFIYLLPVIVFIIIIFSLFNWLLYSFLLFR